MGGEIRNLDKCPRKGAQVLCIFYSIFLLITKLNPEVSCFQFVKSYLLVEGQLFCKRFSCCADKSEKLKSFSLPTIWDSLFKSIKWLTWSPASDTRRRGSLGTGMFLPPSTWNKSIKATRVKRRGRKIGTAHHAVGLSSVVCTNVLCSLENRLHLKIPPKSNSSGVSARTFKCQHEKQLLSNLSLPFSSKSVEWVQNQSREGHRWCSWWARACWKVGERGWHGDGAQGWHGVGEQRQHGVGVQGCVGIQEVFEGHQSKVVGVDCYWRKK